MKLKIPAGEFRAYLFDCDGTVVDSMPLHYIAWKKALGEWGCTLDEDLFYAWGGKPPRGDRRHAEQDARAPYARAEAVAERKENLYYEQLPELKPVPEVLEHIEAQHGRIPFADCLGQQPRVRHQVADHRGSARPLRHPCRLRGLRAQQARARCISGRRRTARNRRERLPGF